LSPEEIGTESESRFFNAVLNDNGSKPSWFIRIERASIMFDIRGVDAWAFVWYDGVRGEVQIPIQVKSSQRGRDDFYVTHPVAAQLHMPVLVISPRDPPESADRICRNLYTTLGDIRRAGIRYDSYIRKIGSRGLNRRELLLQAVIAERRRHLDSAVESIGFLSQTPIIEPEAPPRQEPKQRGWLEQLISFFTP
jgi:hypothetical protein